MSYSPFVTEHWTGAVTPATQYDPAGQGAEAEYEVIEPPAQNFPAGHCTHAPDTA